MWVILLEGAREYNLRRGPTGLSYTTDRIHRGPAASAFHFQLTTQSKRAEGSREGGEQRRQQGEIVCARRDLPSDESNKLHPGKIESIPFLGQHLPVTFPQPLGEMKMVRNFSRTRTRYSAVMCCYDSLITVC